MGSIDLTAELVPHGPAAAFVLDEEQVAIVGEGAKRFPARATINGATLRTTVTRMRGEYLFGLSRAARGQAGIGAGDTVSFTLELDTEPRSKCCGTDRPEADRHTAKVSADVTSDAVATAPPGRSRSG
jgi:hypothetical protein